MFSAILFSVTNNLGFVRICFWIVDGEFSHEEIAGVLVLASNLIHAKVSVALLCDSLVNHVTVCKEQEPITEAERLRARLMNRAHDSLVAFAGQVLKSANDTNGCERVQS